VHLVPMPTRTPSQAGRRRQGQTASGHNLMHGLGPSSCGVTGNPACALRAPFPAKKALTRVPSGTEHVTLSPGFVRAPFTIKVDGTSPSNFRHAAKSDKYFAARQYQRRRLLRSRQEERPTGQWECQTARPSETGKSASLAQGNDLGGNGGQIDQRTVHFYCPGNPGVTRGCWSSHSLPSDNQPSVMSANGSSRGRAAASQPRFVCGREEQVEEQHMDVKSMVKKKRNTALTISNCRVQSVRSEEGPER
jgi:hypothetical protein